MRQKRVVVERYGGPDVITVIEEDVPAPKSGEIQVKVLAAGVSLPDVLAREGVWLMHTCAWLPAEMARSRRTGTRRIRTSKRKLDIPPASDFPRDQS